MGKWISALKWGAAALIAVAVIVLIVMWKRKGGVPVEAGFDSRIELTGQEIRRIEQIGQWEFLSVQAEVVADTVRSGIFSDDRLVAVYTGVPRIGIDMKMVEPDWVSTRGDTVALRLPAVHLLDKAFIDEARTRIFNESGKWSNGARRELYGKAYRKMLRQCLTASNLKRAEDNARRQFDAMFKAMGFRVVEIAFVK
ncbi:MAG: DUF4230 domain-containing protein [Paraprevotella sp.]|nr:DUF4230 domain-containing protein [Paraprevotella sp.]